MRPSTSGASAPLHTSLSSVMMLPRLLMARRARSGEAMVSPRDKRRASMAGKGAAWSDGTSSSWMLACRARLLRLREEALQSRALTEGCRENAYLETEMRLWRWLNLAFFSPLSSWMALKWFCTTTDRRGPSSSFTCEVQCVVHYKKDIWPWVHQTLGGLITYKLRAFFEHVIAIFAFS